MTDDPVAVAIAPRDTSAVRSAFRLLVVATCLLFLVTAGLGIYVLTLAKSNHHLNNCVSDWANATSARTSVLTRVSTARSDRLDALIRDVSGASQQKFHADLALYIKASDAYSSALKMHPLPSSPKLRC
jgi:hypothetical protein